MAQGKQAIGGVLKSLSLLAVLSVVSFSEAVAATPRQLSLGGVEVAQQPANGDSEAIREAADRVYEEGDQLVQQGTAESLKQAIIKFEEAVRLYRQAGDKRSEALSLNDIGYVYFLLGEKQQALHYYNQALPLRRAVGDRVGEATTLNNIGGVYDSLGEKQQALDYFNQALLLSRAVGNRQMEATTLNN
ncbi:MAG: tetratricopeptide repeat protein, partial [Jaaginema sp. PMC 1079.18]|nr:tetratricopeptide repeat protein [Jaaginema sp. PMC 1079.18]